MKKVLVPLVLLCLLGIIAFLTVPRNPLAMETAEHLVGVTSGKGEHISPNRSRTFRQIWNEALAGKSSETSPASAYTSYDSILFWTIGIPRELPTGNTQAFAWDERGNGAYMESGYLSHAMGRGREAEAAWAIPVTPLWGKNIRLSFYTNIIRNPPFSTIEINNPAYKRGVATPANPLPIKASTSELEVTLLEFVTSLDKLSTPSSVRSGKTISPEGETLLKLHIKDLTGRPSKWTFASAALSPRGFDTRWWAAHGIVGCSVAQEREYLNIYTEQVCSDIYDFTLGIKDEADEAAEETWISHVDVSTTAGKSGYTYAFIDGKEKMLNAPIEVEWRWEASGLAKPYFMFGVWRQGDEITRKLHVEDANGVVLPELTRCGHLDRSYDLPSTPSLSLRFRVAKTASFHFRAKPEWKKMPILPNFN